MPNQAHNTTTLLELLDQSYVEVPIVQRDYAQGRKTPQVNQIRATLLNDIYHALTYSQPLDLNFIYGKIVTKEDNTTTFIPLDGQQRLTTLWLLHLYAFYSDSEKLPLLRKFSYTTRHSSKLFLEHLISHDKDIFTSSTTPSAEIKDSAWFLSRWIYDPTVKSMLTMLDAIVEKFQVFQSANNQTLAKQLQQGYLCFQYLNTAIIGSEDDLYIKLNARGKPLSPFDNVKSVLVAQLITHKESLEQEYGIKRSEYEQLLDGKWTDYFWQRSKTNFDTDFLVFLSIFFRNLNVITTMEDGWWYSFSNNQSVDATVLMTLYHTLQFICSDNMPKSEQFLLAMHKKQDDSPTLLSTYTNYTQLPTYTENQLLLHIIIQYCAMARQTALAEDFLLEPRSKHWFRILRNLIINSNNNIDRIGRVNEPIERMRQVSQHWEDLLAYFAKPEKAIQHFDNNQVEEEQAKARIILEHADKEGFSQAITQAEAHPYFWGQIRSALYLAKTTNDSYDLALFEHYWHKLSLLFSDSSDNLMILLRRALLTYGDYRLNVVNKKTLCPTDPRRATSLRSLFSDEHHNKPFLKTFLDDFNSEELTAPQLEQRITTYLAANTNQNNWQYLMIRYAELWDKEYLNPSHLYANNTYGKFLLLKTKQANGTTCEIFTLALFKALNENNSYKQKLKDKGINYKLWLGSASSDHCLVFFHPLDEKKDNLLATIWYDDKHKRFYDHKNKNAKEPKWVSTTSQPIQEAIDYLLKSLLH